MSRALVVAAVATFVVGVAPAFAQSGGGEPADFGFFFEVAPTFMLRSTPSGEGAIVAANPAGTPFLTGDDFNFGWDAGFEASMGVRFKPDAAIEARILWIASDSFVQMTTPGAFIGTGFTGPGGTVFDVNYDTELKSIEGSWRQDVTDQVTLLAGLRAMSIHDVLDSQLNTTVARGEYTYDNERLGVQIGAEVEVLDASSPFQLDFLTKVGAYVQQSQGGIREFQGAAQNFIGEFQSDVETTMAYSAEVGIDAGYHLTENLEVTAGYSVLLLTDVALASDNAAMSLLNPSLLTGDIARGVLIYQGVKVGLSGSF